MQFDVRCCEDIVNLEYASENVFTLSHAMAFGYAPPHTSKQNLILGSKDLFSAQIFGTPIQNYPTDKPRVSSTTAYSNVMITQVRAAV